MWSVVLDAWIRRFAPLGGDLARRGEQVAIGMLIGIRAMTVAATLALALLSPDARVGPLLLLAAVATAEVGWSARCLRRADVGRNDPRALAPLLLDAALVMVAIALSSGADSSVVFAVMVLPIAAAIVVGPWAIIIIGIGGTAGYGVAAGLDDRFAIFAIEVVWASAVAIAVTRQRAAFLRRFGRIDDMTRAVQAPGRHVRDGVGPELRATVAVPLSEIRVRLGRRGTRPIDAAELRGLADGVVAAALQVRSVVSELHAPSGRPAGADGPLIDLAGRRSPSACLQIAVGTEPDPRFDAVLVAIVRDALTVVATPESTRISVAVTPTEHGAAIRVAAEPPPVRDEGDAAERHGVLALRVAAADALLEVDDPERGVVCIRVRDLQSTRSLDARMPLSGVLGVKQIVLFCRILGGLAGVAAGLIAGGNDPLWPVAAAATVLVTLPVAGVLLTRHVRVGQMVALIALDSVPIITTWALSGPETQRALVPIGALLPVVWAFVAGPRMIVAISAAIVLGLSLFQELGDATSAFFVTFAWATAIGVLISTAGGFLGRQLAVAARERNRSLHLVMEGEESERRRLAADLHDDALQLLLAARQDLVEAAEGDPDGAAYALRALDEADAALQYVLGDLDLDASASHVEGGLRAALGDLARDVHVRRRGPVVDLEVERLAEGRRDGLLVRIARELLTNVVRHAAATSVVVSVAVVEEGIRLEVADDGVGFDHGRVSDAPRRGHVGLASVVERVREAGGSTELLDGPGGGALVRVVVPAETVTVVAPVDHAPQPGALTGAGTPRSPRRAP